jgi:hypothetical protein
MSGPPWWRLALGRAEEEISPRLISLTTSEEYAVATGLRRRAERELARRGEHLSRRVLHLLNLPAGSDVNRLLIQIASLEREVRELRKRVTDSGLVAPESKGRPARAAPNTPGSSGQEDSDGRSGTGRGRRSAST